jgi:hypothetical protein
VLQNQVPEAGALAASAFEAGFGGAVWAAAEAGSADAVVAATVTRKRWGGLMVPAGAE